MPQLGGAARGQLFLRRFSRTEHRHQLVFACGSLGSADIAVTPEIKPTKFNYPIAIYGKWHGNKYRFITRYRSDVEDAIEPEFEAQCASTLSPETALHLLYHRHTGEWFRLYPAATLEEALRLIGEGAHFQPC